MSLIRNRTEVNLLKEEEGEDSYLLKKLIHGFRLISNVTMMMRDNALQFEKKSKRKKTRKWV